MSSTDFHVDFESDIPEFSKQYREAAESRLRNLADPHNDIDHATVAVTKLRDGEEPEQFQARVVVYVNHDNLTVTKKDYMVVEALDEALGEIERQIRDRYENSNT